MKCRADEHYRVMRAYGRIERLECLRCRFVVRRSEVSGSNAPGWKGGKSGLPRYNRMRAKMVKHIHEAHPIQEAKS